MQTNKAAAGPYSVNMSFYISYKDERKIFFFLDIIIVVLGHEKVSEASVLMSGRESCYSPNQSFLYIVARTQDIIFSAN